MLETELVGDETDIKVACCNFYEHDFIKLLLGDSLHPGGLELTEQLGKKLLLKPKDKILDLASGLGVSAIFLAEKFGSTITGIDVSEKNVDQANITAQKKGLKNVTFEVADAEHLPYEAEEFDVVISECSFCLFPNKTIATQEMWRVLKPNGRLGLTDVAIEKELPFDAQNILLRVVCIADALSMSEYRLTFENSGFKIELLEDKKEYVLQMISSVKKKIFLAELAKGVKKIDLKNLDLKLAKYWIKQGRRLVNEGYGTYMMLIGKKI
ncbi:MAG: methyltransferase domain-containing protein [Promethearchaeota archaeon]